MSPQPPDSDSPVPPAETSATPAPEGDRIAKVIARAGLCSRREAEEWIAAGRVAVNGTVITSPALDVSDRDRITVDGAPLPARERTRLFLYYKPVGLVTTSFDPEGRPTIFDALPDGLPRLISVGRLDIATEGLLLLTNDGGLARVLELPATGWLRRYRVRAHGSVDQGALDKLRDGLEIDGIQYGPIEATLDRTQGSNVWLTVAIREGKNREVRNVLDTLGLQVNRLIRLSYGPFQLGELVDGEIEEVKTRYLRDQLGPRIAEEAGCDFAGPIVSHAEDAAPLARTARERPVRERPTQEGPARRERSDREPGRESGRPERYLRRPNRDRDEAEAPQGRPRRGHSWRSDDAPLSRHYRGRSEAEKPSREDWKRQDPSEPKRAGLLTDRKGRRVLVERFGEAKPKRAAEARGERSERPGRAPRRDDRGGKRFGAKPRGGHFDRRDDRDEAGPRKRFGDKPFRQRSDDRPGRPPRGEGRGGEKRFGKSFGDKPFRQRSDDRPGRPPRSEAGAGEKRFGKSFGDKPFRKRSDDRPGRPPRSEAGAGEKRFGDKPRGPRPFGKKPGGPKRDFKPGGRKPGRPGHGRPESRDRPRGRGPRPSRPSED